MENQADPISNLLSEFGARLNETEEKSRILKDRILLIGQNLINSKESSDKEISQLKNKVNILEEEIKEIKRLNKRIISEFEHYARNSDLEIIQRQIKMFSPLEFARIKDVKELIKKEISKNKTIKNKKS